jgi:hypothetical protein
MEGLSAEREAVVHSVCAESLRDKIELRWSFLGSTDDTRQGIRASRSIRQVV